MGRAPVPKGRRASLCASPREEVQAQLREIQAGLVAPPQPGQGTPAPANKAAASAAAKPATAQQQGPTDFAGNTTDQIVLVTQNGTGSGLNAVGPTGVYASSNAALGNGVVGTAFGGVGVAGRALSGSGVEGLATASSGTTTGVMGTSYSSGGTGVLGANTAASGETTGVAGSVESPQGTAGWFSSPAGGNILEGLAGGYMPVFTVTGTGAVRANAYEDLQGNLVMGGVGGLHGVKEFLASGSFTVPANITDVMVEMWGAGGGLGGYRVAQIPQGGEAPVRTLAA